MKCVKFHAELNSSKSEKKTRSGIGSIHNLTYFATSQAQDAAGLKFLHRRLIYGFWGGGGANPIFPIFPILISAKSTFISGKSGNSFSPISPSLITLGHKLIHNLYIKVLIALILVYRNSM